VSTSKNIIVDINKRAAADGKRKPVGPAAQGWGFGWLVLEVGMPMHYTYKKIFTSFFSN